MAAGLLALFCGAAPAQILPPIYKPLPVEEGARFRARADSSRAKAAEILARAESLEQGALTLRQNGTGVVEKLTAQADALLQEAGRLESQADADALTADALQAQAEQFSRRAREKEQSILTLRETILRLRANLPLVAPLGTPANADSLDLPSDSLAWDPATVTPSPIRIDTAVAARLRELETSIRADSQTAATFRMQVEELSEQARAREASAATARERVAELRAEADQLRAYAEEITSGRSAGEATAARLEQEARQLRRSAERYSLEAKAHAALADEWRVQAGRTLLPVRSRTEAMRFYGEDGRSVLRNLVFSVGPGGGAGTINSELVSDYAGPIRLGVGFVLAEAGKKDSEGSTGTDAEVLPEEAMERFYAGGGNFVVYSTLPLLFFRSEYHSLTLQSLNKVGLDVPVAGRSMAAGSVPTNLDLGLEAYATFNTFGGKIKAFALVRSAYATGNQAFQENLGMSGDGALPYAQLTFGAEIASVAKVLLSGAHGGDGLSRDLSLTFQVSPNR